MSARAAHTARKAHRGSCAADPTRVLQAPPHLQHTAERRPARERPPERRPALHQASRERARRRRGVGLDDDNVELTDGRLEQRGGELVSQAPHGLRLHGDHLPADAEHAAAGDAVRGEGAHAHGRPGGREGNAELHGFVRFGDGDGAEAAGLDMELDVADGGAQVLGRRLVRLDGRAVDVDEHVARREHAVREATLGDVLHARRAALVGGDGHACGARMKRTT
eukprot:2977006-Prymnesium_polylepis.2